MLTYPSYPATRPRRWRQSPWARQLAAETDLLPRHLVLPIIVQDSPEARQPVVSLPGVARLNLDELLREAEQAVALGIPAVALFPAIDPTLKDATASQATDPNSLACKAIRALRHHSPNLGVMCDVALDLYTSHGHDGLLSPCGQYVDNDATLAVLVQQALTYADAGATLLGPSDMMDGRIAAIRHGLEVHGHTNVLLISYAAKYHSGLYGSYRDAVGSASHLQGASKATYQQNPANALEAELEAMLDVAEGADALMVKPATFYQDVIYRLRQATPLPVWAYHVSGEYAMIEAASANGWLDGERVLHEALLGLRRAGASVILTYGALRMARYLKTL